MVYAHLMANMTTHRNGEILQCVLRILDGEPEGLQARKVIERAASEMVLTDYEQSGFHEDSKDSRFPWLVRFATINAVKAGWIIKSKAIWYITEDGALALDKFSDPEALFVEGRRLYRQWKAGQPDDTGEEVSDEDVEGILKASSLEEADESARQDILNYMGEINPYRFQDLVGKLLEAMDYYVVWIAPKGKDGGLDLLAQVDPLGVTGPRIKGQVKRRPNEKVREDELRSFLSLIDQHDVGVYISLGGFTSDASRHARSTSRRLTLIDGSDLLDLWVDHYSTLDEEARQLLPLRPVYYLDRDALN